MLSHGMLLMRTLPLWCITKFPFLCCTFSVRASHADVAAPSRQQSGSKAMAPAVRPHMTKALSKDRLASTSKLWLTAYETLASTSKFEYAKWCSPCHFIPLHLLVLGTASQPHAC
jgi:hypothetical protein